MTSQIRDTLWFPYVLILDLSHSSYGFTEKPMLWWVFQPIPIEYWQLNVCSNHYVGSWYTWEKKLRSQTPLSTIHGFSAIYIYISTWRQVCRSYLWRCMWCCRCTVLVLWSWSFYSLFWFFFFRYGLIFFFLIARTFVNVQHELIIFLSSCNRTLYS